MTLQLYKMKLSRAHFGSGLLETALPTITCDRLYSAMVNEAFAIGVGEAFINRTLKDDFVLSDTLIEHFGLYFPKPIGYPLRVNQQNELDRSAVKKLKKISMLHEDSIESFIAGNFDTEDIKQYYDEQNEKYKTEYVTRKGIDPYRVGYVSYEDDVYLAFIATKDSLVEQVMTSLQYSGIGGKRTSGYGRFELDIQPLESYIEERITLEYDGPVMLLSTALPIDADLEEAIASGNFLVHKSSGFAFSEQAKGAFRKQDLYKFRAGSTFSRSFRGSIVDVSPDSFVHPVYNFARPIFYRLG
ncbi:type III-A CRISPR-associated RAMP protein Csm4 [Tuanshanicoccus lijuaniae]|uniref:type III-A CRISPR-associated RAMP protein Csm4 n=1 Tax=Aerococcaceae bacterium zg-1292 TaxID=2774330 RepID=UPI001BD8E257|nr:type III-A CRISPR-associated RAMP protein Csm4 [Aerococcaceae bacterium zg-A91]MBS4458502.1 type III-A CRISPR-associated RAMP protein Csm4 [Aerococcaceae bacterium zg-BR33]